MANFIFNWATAALAADTIFLGAGNYYAHLVATTPALGNSTVADLVLPTTSGYTSTPLTGLSYDVTRWTFSSFSFPKYAFISSPTGVVICRRSGASPATTDGIICYSDFANSVGQAISLEVGNYAVNLVFGSNGAINFVYRYRYTSGVFASTEPVPKGSLFLIGSKNNTVAFNNPFIISQTSSTSINGTGTELNLTNRVIQALVPFSRAAYNFSSRSIRVGDFRLYIDGSSGSVQLFGSNSLIAFDNANIADSSRWTLLGTKGSTATSGWQSIPVTDQTYWQYIKFQTIDLVSNLPVLQIEFYNSQVLSPTIDFT